MIFRRLSSLFSSKNHSIRLTSCLKPSSSEKLSQISHVLGFSPNNFYYYEKALIHRSASQTDTEGNQINNERLEFLGDAILGAITADLLFHKYPNKDEGFLTQMRSKIVNGEHLSAIAKKIELDKLVLSSTSSGGIKNILGDAFEALIGAVYLDKGYKIAESFIINKIINHYVDMQELQVTDTNFKSQLIEWCQKNKMEIEFTTELQSEESKFFKSIVYIDGKIQGKGLGKSKKEAEQNAAYETLKLVGDMDTEI